jgi:hypothetical protein
MQKENFEKIVIDFLGESPSHEIVPLTIGSWRYTRFDDKDPELVIIDISFQPNDIKPWRWYSYHPNSDIGYRLGWGITLIEAYKEANPD